VDLDELGLAPVEGLEQLGVGGVGHQLDGDQVDGQLHPLLVAEDRLGDVAVAEQLLVVLALGGDLGLELLHAGVDGALLHGHAGVAGRVQHDLELDEPLESLAGDALDVLGLLSLLLLAELRLDHL
jgi:hypothetical protein